MAFNAAKFLSISCSGIIEVVRNPRKLLDSDSDSSAD